MTETVSCKVAALELDVAGGLRVAKTIGVPRMGTYFLAYADGMEIAGSRVAFVGKIDNDGVWSMIEISMEGRAPTYLAPFLAPNRLWKGRPGNLEGFRVLNRVKQDGDAYSFRRTYVERDGSNIAALSPAFHSMLLEYLAPRAIEEAFATFEPEFLSPTGETLSLTRP